MDLDVALLRAFVATADERHFGRAAERLHVTQQALSKRITRLERRLAVRLLDRTSRSVEVTKAGARFLPHARRIVDAADSAVAALGDTRAPVTVDVLDTKLTALHLARRVADALPELELRTTYRQGMRTVAAGLRNDDFDLALGSAGGVGAPWPDEIHRQLVFAERVELLVAADGRYAGLDEIRLADLRGVPLWFPMLNAPPEWQALLSELADDFDLTIDFGGPTMGFEHMLDEVAGHVRVATFFGSGMPVPDDPRVRVVPIVQPAPLFPWWAMWRRPPPPGLVERFARASGEDPGERMRTILDPRWSWLPRTDRACLLHGVPAQS